MICFYKHLLSTTNFSFFFHCYNSYKFHQEFLVVCLKFIFYARYTESSAALDLVPVACAPSSKEKRVLKQCLSLI